MMTTIIGTINIELWALHIVHFVVGVIVFGVSVLVLVRLLGIRYIPHDKVGIVEKLWSFKGSLSDGKIVAFNGEAGFQTACCAADCTCGSSRGSIASTKNRS